MKPKDRAEINSIDTTKLLQLYHERLAHQNKVHVKKVVERELMIKLENDDSELCKGCVYGKAHRLKFGIRKRATLVGELIHADVCGPFQESVSGYRYFLLFKDDFSKYRHLYLLKQKAEVNQKLKIMLAETKAMGHNIKEILSDGGGEFDNREVKKTLEESGIRQRLTMPYTPEQNGCVERDNRTVVETMRAIMHSKDLPQELWAELASTTVYILNRTGPTHVDKTPYELWCDKKPRIRHLRIIGSECYVHVPKVTRKKLDKKAIKGILVGYENDEGYRVWIGETKKLIRSKDVIFDEKIILSGIQQEIPIETDTQISDSEDKESQSDVETYVSDQISDHESENDEFLSGQEDEEDTLNEGDDEKSEFLSDRYIDQQGRITLRDRSKLKPPNKFHDYVMATSHEMIDSVEPQTFQEAINSDDKIKWKNAMNDEIQSLRDNDTWDITTLPKGRKAIPCKWVYKVKRNSDGTIDRFKARLVVKGYSQRKGVDYSETYSPVARMSTIRTLLSIAAREKMTLTQFDVSTAFLYGSLSEEIYMKQPEGYTNCNPQMVCKLKKSLYGLKQAPRCWNSCIKEFLLKIGFIESEADPCLFIRRRGKEKLILALYVDDGLLASNQSNSTESFLNELKMRFKIKSKPACYFLGLEIDVSEDGSVNLHQTAYTKKLLERFNMDNCNPVNTPMLKDSSTRSQEETEEKFPYRQAVGALAYLMVGTRPDIAYAVSVVSQHLESPSSADVVKVKRIFRYLKGAMNKGLEYRRRTERRLICYSDADHAGDCDTGRSTTGMICTYGGTAISWRSHRQTSVAISSTEAEIVAASETTREIIWLKRLIESIENLERVPILYIDNESAMKLALNPAYELHQRTKHIKIRHFFVREAVTNSTLEVQKVSSELQLADALTKPLFGPRLQMISGKIGMTSF